MPTGKAKYRPRSKPVEEYLPTILAWQERLRSPLPNAGTLPPLAGFRSLWKDPTVS
jgi:hypothetical protein